MKGYEKYKKVGLPWIDEIPEHWEVECLKRIAFYSTGNSIKDEEKKEFNIAIDAHKFITTADIDLEYKKIIHKSGIYIPKDNNKFKLAEKDTILVCIEGGSGGKKIARVDCQARYGNKLCNIKGVKISNGFLYYVICSEIFRKYYNLNINGDRNGVSLEKIGGFLLPIPSVVEQNQVAKFLDWKISEIDNLIELERKKATKLEELSDKIIEEYIFNGIIKERNCQSIDTSYIKRIPKSWKLRKIKELFKIQKRIVGELGYDVLSITQKGVKIKDISKNEGQMAGDYSNYQLVEIGDFAMNHMDLLTGYIDISKYRGVTSPDYRVFTAISKDVFSKYYLYMFQLFYKKRVFYKYGRGAANQGRWRLPAREFLNLYIPVPLYNEQESIVQAIEKQTDRINQLKLEVEHEVVRLKELKQRLISDVVTGKIDVR